MDASIQKFFCQLIKKNKRECRGKKRNFDLARRPKFVADSLFAILVVFFIFFALPFSVDARSGDIAVDDGRADFASSAWEISRPDQGTLFDDGITQHNNQQSTVDSDRKLQQFAVDWEHKESRDRGWDGKVRKGKYKERGYDKDKRGKKKRDKKRRDKDKRGKDSGPPPTEPPPPETSAPDPVDREGGGGSERAIFEAAGQRDCEHYPSFDGHGGGLAHRNDRLTCYALLAVRSIGQQALTSFAELAEGLVDSDREEQLRHFDNLSHINEALVNALPVVIDALSTQNEAARKATHKALNDAIGYTSEVVPALRTVLRKQRGDEGPHFARSAVQSLGSLGAYAVPALEDLLEAMDDEDLGVRFHAADELTNVDQAMRNAARAIEKIALRHRSFEDVASFKRALDQDFTLFRKGSVRTLSEIGQDARSLINRKDDTNGAILISKLGEASLFSTAAAPSLLKVIRNSDYDNAIGGLKGDDARLEVVVGASELMARLPALANAKDRSQIIQGLGETSARAGDALAAANRVRPGESNDFAEQSVVHVRSEIKGYVDSLLPILLRTLDDQSSDLNTRRAAIEAIGKIGHMAEPAVPKLIEILTTESQDGQPGLRPETALALGRIDLGSAPVVSALKVALAKHNPPMVKYRAAEALSFLGQSARPAENELKALLFDGDRASSYQATKALQALDPNAERKRFVEAILAPRADIPTLLGDLLGDDAADRKDALRTASNMGPSAVGMFPKIVASLADADPDVQIERARNLKRIAAAARGDLHILVDAVAMSETPDSETRRLAAEALGELGGDAVKASSELQTFLASSDAALEAKSELVAALGDMGVYAAATAKALTAAALRDPIEENREIAGESLGQQIASR